jgi:uncharacterized protein
MKFQPDTLAGVNAITRHEAGRIWVGPQAHGGSVIVPWRGQVQDWQARDFDALGADHFARLLALQPELVLFGSGERLRFPPPAWLAALFAARVGVETMDTAAACRTYNVLASEGRPVVAALLLAAAPAAG